jgi:GNAT superfamily N-acetyltransferase
MSWMESYPSVRLRPATEKDDLDALNVGNRAWMGAATLRRLFAAAERGSCGSFIAEIDGEQVGYGDYAAIPVMDGHRAPASVYVKPAQRGKGVGYVLWESVLGECTPDRVSGVMLTADADDIHSVNEALRHGFQLGGVHIESELDLIGMDFSLMRNRAGASSGLSIHTLPDDADNAMWHQFALLQEQVERDTPDRAAGAEPAPYPVLRAFLEEPWQVMGAWNENELVGFTAVSVQNTPSRKLNTFLTGVLPAYRGKGVATALKSSHALALAQAGWRTIRTQNMDVNVPILASNKTLGFRQVCRLRDLTFDHPSA